MDGNQALKRPAFTAHRVIRAATVLALALLAVTLAGIRQPVRAQDDVTLAVTAAFEGNYAPDRWLPLSIVLRNAGPPTRVTVAVASPLIRPRNTALVDLPGGGESALTLYAAMDRSTRELAVTVEREGAVLAEQRVAVRPREGERLLALVSARPLALRLPRREELAALPLLPFAFAPEQLPERPAGLSSLTVIVLGDLPAQRLTPAQLAALHAWVRAGGHLVIGGGPGAAATLAALPAPLRLAEIGAVTALDPQPLGVFADAPPPGTLQGVALRPAPDTRPFGSSTAPLWTQRELGAGRVTQLAFDPGLSTLQSWPGAPTLWDRLLSPVRIYRTVGFDLNGDGVQAQILSSALGYLPVIALPDSTPLFALLVAYTVLIGPGLALLLHRLDRQELGWVVLPAVALGAGAIALGLALASRADERIVTQAALVEQVDDTTARVRTSFGLLTPRDERFTVAVGGDAVARPLVPGTARFGAIDSAGGDLAQEGAALALDVSRWRLEGTLVEALVDLPAIDAELQLGAEGITLAVRNTSGQPLRDVRVVYAGHALALGDLAPDETAMASWPPSPRPGEPRPQEAKPLSVLVLGDQLAAGRAPGSAPERRVLIREALLNAAVATGVEGQAPEPLVLAWLDASPLPLSVEVPGAAMQYVGLLVARPRITGSGAATIPAGWMQLELANAPRPTCTGEYGRGLAPALAPLIMTLALPADLATFQAASATLDLQSTRPWPNAGVTTELFNWQTDAWVALSFDGPGSIVINDAAPFVQGGRLRLRLAGRIDEAECVFASATLRGALP